MSESDAKDSRGSHNANAEIHSVLFCEYGWVNEMGEQLPDAGMEQALEWEALYCQSYAEVDTIEQLVELWNGGPYNIIKKFLDNFERALDEGTPLAYYSDRPLEISGRYRVPPLDGQESR